MAQQSLKDKEQRDLATAELDRSFIVEAGAGTGKTSLLLERVKNVITSEKAEMRHLVIITFTEKAAAELKMRLRNRLEEEYKKTQKKRKKKESSLLVKALEDFEHASISTIHSFAAAMLKERPVEAKVDPQFDVADDLTLSLLFDESWRNWLEMEMHYSAPALARALKLGITIEAIREIAVKIVNNRDLYNGKPIRVNASVSHFLKTFEKDVAALLRQGKKHCTDREDKGYQQIQRLKHDLEGFRAGKAEEYARLIFDISISSKKGNRRNWKPARVCDEIKKLFEKLQITIEGIKEKLAQDICADLADWLGGFLKYMEQEKRNRGYLDFEDLLISARDMLRDNTQARGYFQKRFRYIFVDEFQDTDPLQTEIIFFLSEKTPKAEGWDQVNVKEGRLFLVGDPKQSIYRFRRADVEIYNRAKNLLLKRGKRSDIVMNFRSAPSIVRWVNHLFSDLIKSEGEYEFQPDYSPIEAERNESYEESSVIMITAPEDTLRDQENLDNMRALESRYIASLIRSAIEKRTWMVQEKRGEDPRECRFSDFAILFRKTTGIGHYEEAFRAYDIPYRIVGSRYFYKRQEVISLLSVMKAIDNPSDEISVVAALRSEFFGHSDEELFLFKERGGRFHPLKNKKSSDEISRSFDLLCRLHWERNTKSISLVLMNLFHETKAMALNYLKPQGEQRVANLLKIVDMARLHEKTALSHFKSFTRWLEEMQVEEREAEESPTIEEDDDAVRMMTIHKAKGLEFPFVIVGLLESGGRKKESFIVDRASGRFEFAFAGLKPERYEKLKDLEERRADAEERRIFYVAATRAKEKLILPIFPKRRSGGIITYLEGKLPENVRSLRGKDINGLFFFDESQLSLESVETQPFKVIFDEEYLQRDFSDIVEKRNGWLKHLSELKQKAVGGLALKSATSIKEEISLDEESGAIKKMDRNLEIGKAVHAILSEIDLDRSSDIEKWAQLKMARFSDPTMAREVTDLVRKALAMNTLREAISNRYYREVPFSLEMNDVMLEGSIDLLYEKEGYYIAADYKTDKIATAKDMEKRMRNYEIQASIYAFALSKILKKDFREIRFLFLNIEDERAIPIDEARIERGRSLIDDGDQQIKWETEV